MKSVDRRTFSICLATILMLSIPLCFFVFMSSPKTLTLWLNDNFWFSDDPSRDPRLQSADSEPSRDFSSNQKGKELPLLLLVSYDGFRYDYIEKNLHVAPTFQWLIKNGVHATQGLKNTFITITAPNHYDIVTGLYEETHGIIANSFYDPDLNETFDYFNTRWKTNPKFFGGQPVWNINDAADENRATGCMMWVGCDVPINNRTPIHHVSWDQNLAWPARVDAVVSWFKDPRRPVNFGLLYIEEPDETGHRFGPDSPNITDTIAKLDQLTAYLLARLYMADLLDRINIIFTADHGMASVPVFNVIDMDKYLNRSLYTVYGGTPNWNVKPAPGKEKEVYETLHNKVPHLNVYNKSDIPADYHYKKNHRIMPIQLESDVHWWISYDSIFSQSDSSKNNDSSAPTMPTTIEKQIGGRKILINLTASNYTTGEHGYNNSYPDMHPYFIGYGTAFKRGYNVSQFMNLDLFELMCYILELKPTPNNGSFDRVRLLLKDEGRKWSASARSGFKQRKFGYDRFFPFFTSTTPSPISDVTVEYEFSAFYTSNNGDLVVMLLIVAGYVLFMLFLTSSLKRYEMKNRQRGTVKNPSIADSTANLVPPVYKEKSEKIFLI